MTSPLLPFANSRLLIQAPGAVTESDGRMIQGTSTAYLVRCFLKRADSQGTESGAKKVPSTRGDILPGTSGQVNLYRGYALQYTAWTGSSNLASINTSGVVWTDINERPEWIFPGLRVSIRVGVDAVMSGMVEQASGIFGGLGIDNLVYGEIGGIPLIISAAQLQG